MNWPYKYVKVRGGAILLYHAKSEINDPTITFDVFPDGTTALVMSDFYIPVEYICPEENNEQYYLYMAGSDPKEIEAIIFNTVVFDQKLLTKLEVFKEMHAGVSKNMPVCL